MDLDIGLGPHGPQFLEAPMLDEEWEVFEEIMEDGAGMLADTFMTNLVLHINGQPNNPPQMHDVVFEDELMGSCGEDDDDDLFDLF